MRCGQVGQQGREVDLFRRRRHHVAVAHIHLERDAGLAQQGEQMHPDAAVFEILADRRRPHGLWQEHEPVVLVDGELELREVAEHLLQPREIAGAEAEQVEVVRRPMRARAVLSGRARAACGILLALLVPEREQERPLDHELSGIGRAPQAVQEPLQPVAHEQQLELLLALVRQPQQACGNGGAHVARLARCGRRIIALVGLPQALFVRSRWLVGSTVVALIALVVCIHASPSNVISDSR